MSSDVIEHDDDTGRRRHGDGKGRKNRHRPFASVLLVGLLAVPALALVLRFLIALNPGVLGLAIALVAILLGAGGVLFALGIGRKVSRRIPFIYWHVASTVAVFALWLCTTMGLSWENIGGVWYERLLDVAVVPVWWWVIHIVGALFVSGSWLLYRIDSLRSAAAPGSTGSGSWQELFGKGVTPIMAEAVVTEDAVEVPLSHPGVPLSRVRQGIPLIDDEPGVIAGKTTIVRDGEHGGRSKLRFAKRDALKRWEPWPGLSHPGETFEHPISTARYDDLSPQWYSFAKTPKGVTFAKAPEFSAPSGTFIGRQGMTGAGKSGDAGIEVAEVLSRRDVIVIYVDNAKLQQNASWCLDMVTFASGNETKTNALFSALYRLGQLRSDVIEGRDFSSRIAAETGRPWIYIFADEFDVVKQGKALDWLLTKGRSLGFRFSFTLPRGTAKNMGSDIRAAIGTWKQFGLTQDYDAGMVLDAKTFEAGADPGKWKSTMPGAHYMDGAPGVAEARYAMDCRTYQTEEDYSDLREAVLAARATFTPMTLPPDELEAMGDVVQLCHPSRATAAPTTTQEDPDMQDTLNLSDFSEEGFSTGDPEIDELLANAPSTDTSHITAMFGEEVDPRQPIVQPDVDAGKVDLTAGSDKPRVSPAEAVAEFEAALIRMAKRGVTEFGNADLMDEMRVRMTGPDVSKRFSRIVEGEVLMPDGLTLERIPGRRGRFLLGHI